MTEGQKGQNNMPPDLQFRGHKKNTGVIIHVAQNKKETILLVQKSSQVIIHVNKTKQN